MKLISAVAALALAGSQASAHYIFIQFALGSTKYAQYEHIRKNTNNNSPVTDLTSNDLRCNVGGASGSNTTTLDVKAGDAFTFTTDQAVYHQGPISLYLSKAPGNAADYDGSGGWTKFQDFSVDFSKGSGSAAVWPLRQTYTSNIPKCIANGQYLLRIQSLAIHNPGSPPQFYTSCAQINVSGGGSTVPPSNGLIPGLFKATDPGYTVNIYNPDFKSYTVPGGSVFTC